MQTKIDWVTVLLYAVILIFGWLNIYAACYDEAHAAVFDFSTLHGKEMMWIGASLVIALIITLIDPHIFSSTAYLIYFAVIGLLILTLFIGDTTNGGTSWIKIGSFKFQASEFAKFATALALAKYMSTLDLDYKQIRTKIIAWAIILFPAGIIILQHDTGSALVFASFLLPLYREGMSAKILVIGLVAVVLFVLALLMEKIWVIAIIGGLALIALFYLFVWLNKRTMKHYIWVTALFLICTAYVFSVDLAFEKVLQPHQRERIDVLLGKADKETSKTGTGYNVYQSKLAIGSGGLIGKGFLNGTITKADFVPEQETDFIFCTVGEEWGFVGSTLLILAYIALLLRLVRLAERQYSKFSRFYGYSVAGILFIHILINIGMVLGLLPVIGIPLPFFSYGGSSLMAFTILLFIFLRQDQERTNLI
ncbi:MAG: rod shape-determining protein RodA [Bacteroidales bacterium]|nr:rod shape-determining protein RodA [Bacteroidales bacterium]